MVKTTTTYPISMDLHNRYLLLLMAARRCHALEAVALYAFQVVYPHNTLTTVFCTPFSALKRTHLATTQIIAVLAPQTRLLEHAL